MYGYFWAYLLLRHFFSSLWTAFASYICQLSQHALLLPGYHLQLVQCVFVLAAHFFSRCFLFNQWIYLIKVLQLRLHSWYGTPGCTPIVLCSNSHDAFFCANTHNSYGLICCSFPLASAFPLLPTNGLNGSGSQSATPVGGKITTLFLFTRSLSLLPFLCCPLLHVHPGRSLKAPPTLAEACWDL